MTIPTTTPGQLVDDREATELERDARALHDQHLLVLSAGTPRRRALRPVMKLVRRVAQTVVRPMLDHQSSFNGATARAVSVLRNQGIRHERLLLDLRAALGENADAFLEMERTARLLEREIEPLFRRAIDLDQLALANAFRGSEESVKERQQPYVELFSGKAGVLDLGCGRGEFLQLLREADIEATGVDLDTGMVEHCREKGLVVEQRNALDYLSGVPDDSVGGIFAAQFIEHLAAVDVVRLVREAYRALTPSGVLLLESVNPEALVTFAEFYIDPTHVRPYHAQSVRWLIEQEGFVDVGVELSVDPDPDQPLPPLADSKIDSQAFDQAVANLNTLVYGRRAYAVAGTKPPTTL